MKKILVKVKNCTLYYNGKAYKVDEVLEIEEKFFREDYLEKVIQPQTLPALDVLSLARPSANMATIQIDGGKRQKVRPGDILGALTGDKGIKGEQVGKINVFDNKAYVAVKKNAINIALKKLANGKMKGKTFKVRHLVS